MWFDSSTSRCVASEANRRESIWQVVGRRGSLAVHSCCFEMWRTILPQGSFHLLKLFLLVVIVLIGCSTVTPTPMPISTSTAIPPTPTTIVLPSPTPTYIPYSMATVVGTATPKDKQLLEMFGGAIQRAEQQTDFCMSVEYHFGDRTKRETYKVIIGIEDLVWFHTNGSDTELEQLEKQLKSELATLLKISVPMLNCIYLEGSAFGWPMYN